MMEKCMTAKRLTSLTVLVLATAWVSAAMKPKNNCQPSMMKTAKTKIF